MMRSKHSVLILSIACMFLAGYEANAEEPFVSAEADHSLPDFSTESLLTGNWGGLRQTLHDRGVDLTATGITETFGNTSGGTRRGAIEEGRLEMDASVDFEKAFGWQGLTAFANAYAIQGRGLSGNNLNNIMTVSNIEATRTLRLFDLWAQKNFSDDKVSIRVGQIAADDEFTTSQYAATFISSVFGWPSSLATNLPSGGPAYPLATPGARLRLGNGAPWTLLTAVFDGNPGGSGKETDPQRRDINGTAFNLDRGALVMNEISYAHNSGKEDTGLAGTYKLGLWYHTENFADLRYDQMGRSLSDSLSSGVARVHHGNYGLYGVVDQALWSNPDAPDQSLGVFARVFWNPADRNTAAYQIDGGVNVKGLIDGRPDDVLGLGGSFIGISDSASGADRDANFYSGTTAPVRDYESEIEVTYQATLTPWLSVQPDFQYVMHPGGNIANPTNATGLTPIKDAAILGLRMTAKF